MNSYLKAIRQTPTATRGILFLAFLIFFSQLPNYFGEDIVNARNNYLVGSRTDFWGGISTLVYGFIPSFGFRWQIWLAILQISLSTFALILVMPKYSPRLSTRIIKLLLVYVSLIFSVQMTRDSLMFSLLLLGLSMLVNAPTYLNRRLAFGTAIGLIVLGMSFRPWLSLSLVPLGFYLLDKKQSANPRRYKSLILIFLVLMPITLELSATKALSLKKSSPEQQVMIMDAAASYCYSNNYETGVRAQDLLGVFTKKPNFKKEICQFFRPDTWLSLTAPANASTEGMKSDFWIIPEGKISEFSNIRNKWISLLIHDPITYLQNKILFAGKLLIGSDSRTLSIASADGLYSKIAAVVKSPFEIVISLHLISTFITIFVLIAFPIIRAFRTNSESIKIDKKTLYLLLTLIIWIGSSSVAYIGSNGRYTYSISLICLIFFAMQEKKVKSINMNSEILIVVPCFNEESRFSETYWQRLTKQFPHVFWLFVDDGSTDKTNQILMKFCQSANTEVLSLQDNHGKGNAIRAGMQRAISMVPEKKVLGFLDADGAFEFDDIARFISLASNKIERHDDFDWEILISSRVAMAGRNIQRSLMRHYLGRIFATYLTRGWKHSPYDTQSGFKLFLNSPSLELALKTPFITRWFFDIELIVRYGDLIKLEKLLWEEPLKSWIEVGGSKIRPHHVFSIISEARFARKQIQEILTKGRLRNWI